MKNRVLYLFLILAFFMASESFVVSESNADEGWESGGEPWAFLKMGVGARAMGMGGAFVALADDATAPYWNPAGLGLLREKTATAMYVRPNPSGDEPASGIGTYEYLSYCHPTDEFGNFGISFNYFRIDDIIPTVATPDGDFKFDGLPEDDKEWALNFSYGLPFLQQSQVDQRKPIILLGTNGRIMSQEFMGYSTKGLGFDIGAIVFVINKEPEVNDPIENLKVGYVLKYNSRRSWKGGDYIDPASLGWQLGLSSRFVFSSSSIEQNVPMIIAISLIRDGEGVPLAYAFGSEIKSLGVMAFRAGWRRMRESNIFTAGIGYERKPIQVDYAIYAEYLGIRHWVSLSAKF